MLPKKLSPDLSQHAAGPPIDRLLYKLGYEGSDWQVRKCWTVGDLNILTILKEVRRC